MDWVSQDGNQMTGLIGPVAMAPYCRGANWRGIKALMTGSARRIRIIIPLHRRNKPHVYAACKPEVQAKRQVVAKPILFNCN